MLKDLMSKIKNYKTMKDQKTDGNYEKDIN